MVGIRTYFVPRDGMCRCMVQLVVALLVVVARSFGAYTIVSVPSGSNSTLEGYLCGPSSLLSNGTALSLEAGEHVISAGPFCSVSNLKDIAITGAGRDQTIVRCGDGGRGFRFSFIANLTLARIMFVNCGLATTVFSIFDGNFTSPVVLYLDFSSVTLQRVEIASFYGFGIFGYAIYNSALSDVHFVNCADGSAYCSGALLYATSLTQSVTLLGCLFENLSYPNTTAIGTGLTLWNWRSGNSVRLGGCVFKNLSSLQGSLVLYETFSTITNCTFEALVGGALSAYSSVVFIINSTFIRNTAFEGGAINTNRNFYLSISGSTFDGNIANEWGGAVNLFKPARLSPSLTTTMSITNCVFTNNAAQIGGAVFIFDSFALSRVIIDQTTLQNNSAPIGAAIYAADFRNGNGSATYSIILSDLLVQENHCLSCKEQQEVTGAAIYYTEVSDVILYSYSGKGSQFVGNSPEGAIQGLGGGLHVYGNIMFRNNTGENGGALGLLNNAHIYFHSNCNILFYENTASTYGGALYIQGDPNIPKSILIECAMHFVDSQENYSIIFEGNKAYLSGQSIYATPIYNCTLEFPDWTNNSSPFINHPSAYYDHAFNVTTSKSDASDIQILSFPVNILVCECDTGTECDLTDGYKILSNPGKTVRFHATSVDAENHTSPAVVFTKISPYSQSIRFGAQQNVQWIGKACDIIQYQIYGQENTSFDLLLSTFMGDVPTLVQVTLRPCMSGFVLAQDSTGALQCNCSSFLTSSNIVCNISSGTVTRNDNKWIGVCSNGTKNLSAVSYTCPLEYCKSSITQISLAEPEQLCELHRQGVLCGHCSNSYSAVFGSANCQACSNVWILSILLYAVLGVILVMLLFMLNLTVTQGTIYGLIFYANIIQVNASIFFNLSLLEPLQIIVSFINLDLGFPLCFYDGMDDAAKTGLQFVFPAYLLVLTITASMVCHYCLRQSSGPTITSTNLNRFSRFVGKRAVSVLATLIYLSYSKLLRTVIQILTYATIKVDGNPDIRVWFYDGTIHYLQGRHLPLFIIAIGITILFLLPYTMALTFIPIIDRYSDQNKFFSWLNQQANLLKPMNDAYYAPYKGVWRSWLGVRLWLLVILYVPTPFYSSDRPYLLMYIHSIILVSFLFVQAHVKPFGELLNAEGSRIKWLFAEVYNWMDSFYVLNYTILAITMSYLLSNSDSDFHNLLGLSVGSLVGLFGVMFVATIVYHVIVALRTVFMTRVVHKERETSTICTENPVTDDAYEEIDVEKPVSPTVSYVQMTDYELREPLMEDI